MTEILLINPNTTKSITDLVLKTAKGFASKGTRLRALTGSFGPRVAIRGGPHRTRSPAPRERAQHSGD